MDSVYKALAERLDELPNGYPPTDDGRELKILEKLFSPEEAALASQLSPALESVGVIAARTGVEASALRDQLKGLSRRGLINAGKVEDGLGFGLMPFVVGFYENQVRTMDAEMARLFEDYFQGGFGGILSIQPQVHRVIPVNETIRNPMEVRPFESAAEIVNAMQSWAVQDCICRKQKALIGEACEHPIEMCFIMHPQPDKFADIPGIRALTHDEAMATLRHAAEIGLVHTVSNSMEGTHYICNCCTCSCGILRGMAELGISNVVASSAFVNQVDELLCSGCEDCIPACQFKALSMDGLLVSVDQARCTGCGLCVITCSTAALGLVRRPEDEIKPIPHTHEEWNALRSAERGI